MVTGTLKHVVYSESRVGLLPSIQDTGFSSTEEDEGTDDRTLMYYVNDGVYGSFNCILYDHAHCLPTLHKVTVGDFFFFHVIWILTVRTTGDLVSPAC